MAGVNICFISKEMPPFYYGGIGVQFQVLMRFLRDLDHEVYFVTRRPEILPDGWQTDHYHGISVHFAADTQTPLNGHRALDYARLVAGAVHRLTQTTPIDLIVAAEFGAESFGLLAHPPHNQDGREIPVIITLNGPSPEILHSNGRTPTAYDRVVCAMEDAVMSQARMLISPSRRLWSELSGRLRLEQRPYRTIPNFCDRSVFKPAPKSETAARKRIVYVGRLQRVKGVDLLIEAFTRIATEMPDCELVMIGRDLEWPEYQTTFTAYWSERLPAALLARIQFPGPLSPADVAKELGRAWIAVFPSRWEAFGIAALESLSMGVPVIVSEGTGLAEVVGKGYPLTVEAPERVESLSEQIAKVLGDAELRARLANQALARAEDLHRDATEQWRLAISEIDSVQDVQTGPAAAAFEPVFAALNDYIAERDRLASMRLDESRERDDRIRLLDEKLKGLAIELISRDQLIAVREEQIARSDNTILAKDELLLAKDGLLLAKDGLLELRWSELQHLTAEVLLRDELIETKDKLIERLTREVEAKRG